MSTHAVSQANPVDLVPGKWHLRDESVEKRHTLYIFMFIQFQFHAYFGDDPQVVDIFMVGLFHQRALHHSLDLF